MTDIKKERKKPIIVPKKYIELDDNFTIEISSSDFTSIQKRESGGEKRTYHMSLYTALLTYKRYSINTSTSIKDVMSKIIDLEKKVIDPTNKITIEQ